MYSIDTPYRWILNGPFLHNITDYLVSKDDDDKFIVTPIYNKGGRRNSRKDGRKGSRKDGRKGSCSSPKGGSLRSHRTRRTRRSRRH